MQNSVVDQILALFDPVLLLEFGNRNHTAKDVDILIISEDFNGISTLKRKDLIKRIDKSLDPVCLTSRQFYNLKKNNSSLYNCLKNNHRIIHGDKTTFF